MRYLCYLEDHEQFVEFKPDWERLDETAPRTIYLIPATDPPLSRQGPQLQLQFSP